MKGNKRKEEIRNMIWDLMLRKGIALPPLPPHGRIPNFKGADIAADRVFSLPEWRRSSVVKINPDSPQRHLRLRALIDGKILLMPTPRIRRGFLYLDPKLIPQRAFRQASTIRGAFKWGTLLENLEDLKSKVNHVDLIIEGSVAVDLEGNRLGKGEGYGELEYAILKELGILSEDVLIVTTVHDVQVVDFKLPQDPFDVPVDIIATPSKLIRVKNRRPRPSGLLLDKISEKKLQEIPLLKELMKWNARHKK